MQHWPLVCVQLHLPRPREFHLSRPYFILKSGWRNNLARTIDNRRSLIQRSFCSGKNKSPHHPPAAVIFTREHLAFINKDIPPTHPRMGGGNQVAVGSTFRTNAPPSVSDSCFAFCRFVLDVQTKLISYAHCRCVVAGGQLFCVCVSQRHTSVCEDSRMSSFCNHTLNAPYRAHPRPLDGRDPAAFLSAPSRGICCSKNMGVHSL